MLLRYGHLEVTYKAMKLEKKEKLDQILPIGKK
jgi:hypothetical protein